MTKLTAFLLAITLGVAAQLQNAPHPASSSQTFTNPLLPSGPDPWVTQRDGFYYYMNSTGRNLQIRKTRSIPDLRAAEPKAVYTPPPGQPYSQELWAPELHFLRGKWYIYFAADDGQNRDHRLWVIQNASPDPTAGAWSNPQKLTSPDDHWAIDPDVFENKGQLYLVWSGWKGDKDGVQNLYLAHLLDPTTLDGKRVEISHPTLPWETVGDLPGRHVNVNEGPEVIHHGNLLILTYSASGCWTDAYTLGEMTASVDSDLLDPASWHKIPHPVLSTNPPAHAFGPGHNSFFKSPDGTEDWIIYHANPEPGEGCKNFRSPRAQRVVWLPNGTAAFRKPVPLGEPLPIPRQ